MSKIDVTTNTPVPEKWFLTIYEFHVFHPRTAQHAGTLSLITQHKSYDLNSTLGNRDRFWETLRWHWKGSPYGTLRGRYQLWTRIWALLPPHADRDGDGDPSNDVRLPTDLIGQALYLTSDRWPQDVSKVHPTDVRPLHPWFSPSDSISLGDNNFVPYPQRPPVTRPAEVVFKWRCKCLSFAWKSSPDKII
jgi:hypothetical protein